MGCQSCMLELADYRIEKSLLGTLSNGCPTLCVAPRAQGRPGSERMNFSFAHVLPSYGFPPSQGRRGPSPAKFAGCGLCFPLVNAVPFPVIKLSVAIAGGKISSHPIITSHHSASKLADRGGTILYEHTCTRLLRFGYRLSKNLVERWSGDFKKRAVTGPRARMGQVRMPPIVVF